MCCNTPAMHHHHVGGHYPGRCFCGCQGAFAGHETKEGRIDGLANQLKNLQAQASALEEQINKLKQGN